MSAYDYFLAFFKEQVKQRGHGIQAELARVVNRTERHISAILKEKSRAGIKLQEKITGFFGFTYEEMLREGRRNSEPENLPKRKKQKNPMEGEEDVVVDYELAKVGCPETIYNELLELTKKYIRLSLRCDYLEREHNRLVETVNGLSKRMKGECL